MMHKAVLNEATAAGMLYTAGWDKIIREKPGKWCTPYTLVVLENGT